MKINKWKMALLAWMAMFPFSTLLNYGFAQVDFTAHCPLIIRTFLLTGLLVPYMVFGAFPFLNRYFRTWLQAGEGSVSSKGARPAIAKTPNWMGVLSRKANA